MTEPPAPDDDLGWLVDRAALHDLVHEYCYRAAARDIDGVLALFAPDGWMDLLGDRHEGLDALRRMYDGAMAAKPKPFIHNLVVERVGPDEARGRCVAEIRNLAGEFRGGFGRYDDEFVRVDGVWRFAGRTYSLY